MLGYQNWRDLSFLHWSVPLEAMREVVPPALELDTWEGRVWLGVVPFAMEKVRPWWWPKSLAMSFLETNLRTYVRYQGVPGVYFLSLDAASLAAVLGARWGWSLPYHHARMQITRQPDSVAYHSRRVRGGAAFEATVRKTEPLGESAPGGEAFWLVERYHLFVSHRRRIWRGTVRHTPYPLWSAELVGSVQESLFSAVNLPPAQGAPEMVHYSPGVDVEIVSLNKMGTAAKSKSG